MKDDVIKRLKELKTEDCIWILYIGIIILSLYSNTLERKYFLYNDKVSKEKYRKITIGIFTILVFVYAYFLNDSMTGLNDKSSDLTKLSFVGSLLIFISGIIFLYIAIMDKDINVEVAFN